MMKKEDKASQWIAANIPVTSILLDKHNLRIAWMEDPNIGQSTLIKLFWENYDIKEIIKSIEISGFYKHEVPVLIKDSEQEGRYIVIEGNRRLAALKIIQNPELISLTQKRWLIDLSQKVKSEIEIIPVYIAPSRNSCIPLLVSKHASEDHSSWKPLMQAYLYWNYMQEHPGVTRDTAAAYFSTTSATFNEYLRIYNLFRLIKEIDGLDSEVQKNARDAIAIPISTFERILKNRKVTKYLNISDDWNFTDEEGVAFFNNAMRSIVTDIINKTENSRTLNTATEIERFFFAHNPQKKSNPAPSTADTPENPGASSGQTSSTTETIPSNPTEGEGDTPQKKPVASRETKSIMRTKIPFALENAMALKIIYNELYKLKVDEAPNASVVLFRVFLDKATRKFMERNGLSKCPIVNSSGNIISEKSFIKADFNDCLQYLVSPNCSFITDPIRNSLRLFLKSVGPGKGQIFGLNNLVHNHEITYTADEAKALWPQFESYVKILLTE